MSEDTCLVGLVDFRKELVWETYSVVQMNLQLKQVVEQLKVALLLLIWLSILVLTCPTSRAPVSEIQKSLNFVVYSVFRFMQPLFRE